MGEMLSCECYVRLNNVTLKIIIIIKVNSAQFKKLNSYVHIYIITYKLKFTLRNLIPLGA
jgi:hypothetical protein